MTVSNSSYLTGNAHIFFGEKYLLKSSAPLMRCCLSSLLPHCTSFYRAISWIQGPYQMHELQIFPPCSRLCFHFLIVCSDTEKLFSSTKSNLFLAACAFWRVFHQPCPAQVHGGPLCFLLRVPRLRLHMHFGLSLGQVV